MVGSSIWRRRIIYFLTVIASVYLLAYPWNAQIPASAEFTTPLRPLSDVIRLVGIALPGAASRWTNAYARDPLQFILCGGLVGLLLWLSANLKGRITDQMRLAWRHSLGKFDVHTGTSKASTEDGPFQIAIYGFLVLIALYPLPATFGYPIPKVGNSFQILIDRLTQPYFQFFAIAIPITMLLPASTIAWFRLKDGYRQTISNIKLWIAPALFAVVFLFGGIELASHYIFNIGDSFGAFCKPDPAARELEVCRQKELIDCKAAMPAIFQPPARRHAAAWRRNSTRAIYAPRPGSSSRNAQLQIRDPQEGRLVLPRGGLRSRRNAVGLVHARRKGWFAGHHHQHWAARRCSPLPIRSGARSDRPFGRVIIRYGQTGNEENFIDPDPDADPKEVTHLEEKFRPTRDGELYVYLNKPVSGFWPGLFNGVNKGTAKIRVYRVPN